MAEEDIQNVVVNDNDMNDDALGSPEDDQELTLPTKTYKVDNGRIMSTVDGLDAMVQAIQKLLSTERSVYDIYTKDYGHDLLDIIGKDRDYAMVEAERLLIEALKADDRITNVKVDDIYIDVDSNLIIYATVDTIFGSVNIEQEVE